MHPWIARHEASATGAPVTSRISDPWDRCLEENRQPLSQGYAATRRCPLSSSRLTTPRSWPGSSRCQRGQPWPSLLRSAAPTPRAGDVAAICILTDKWEHVGIRGGTGRQHLGIIPWASLAVWPLAEELQARLLSARFGAHRRHIASTVPMEALLAHCR